MAAPASFYLAQSKNDIYWRCLAPASVLGLKVFHLTPDDWRQVAQGTCPRLRWTLDPEVSFPDHEGKTAVFVRPEILRATVMRAMSEILGIRCLTETDDNYMANMSQHPYLSHYWTHDLALMHLKLLCSADGIIFSTEALRDTYYSEIRKRFGRLDLELHVCRNHIPDTDWPEPSPRDGPVRVGWMGSPSHDKDVEIILPVLESLLRERHDVEVVMIGHLPARRRWQALKLHPRFRHIPWIDPELYTRPALPLDIGLIPIQWSEMAGGKSDVKAIEYTISGAAVVAQSIPIYTKDWKHGDTCLHASTSAEFLQHATRLIEDERLRERLTSAAQDYVRSHRGSRQIKEEWSAALDI